MSRGVKTYLFIRFRFCITVRDKEASYTPQVWKKTIIERFFKEEKFLLNISKTVQMTSQRFEGRWTTSITF